MSPMEIPDRRSPAPGRRLFSTQQVVIATVIGSLIAGILLIWLNYRAMQRPDLATRVALAGLTLQGILLFLGFVLPESPWLSLTLMFAQILLVWLGTERLQGPAIHYHLRNGGATHSTWLAVGMGFAVGFALLILFVAGIMVTGVPPATLQPASQAGSGY
ncbi:MAG: hypothetical protein H6993_07455 [Pseudomonadales bacterium]|nr:hypothetical protein [Pseudomonadales bacterium]